MALFDDIRDIIELRAPEKLPVSRCRRSLMRGTRT